MSSLLVTGYWSGEFKAVRKDSSLIDIFTANNVVQDKDGNVIGYVGVSRDITQEKQVQEELEHRQILTRELLDSLNQPTALVMADGAIADANRAWRNSTDNPLIPGCESCLNYADELTRAAESGVLEMAAALEGLHEVLLGSRTSFSIEYPWSTAAGPRWGLMEVTAFDSSVPGAVVTHRDITEERQATEAMEEAVDMRDKFIASLAHQIRTPLAAVVGFAQLLSEPTNQFHAGETGEMVELLVQQSSDLAAMVENLLANTRADQGLLSIEGITVDVSKETAAITDGLTVADRQRIHFRPRSLEALGDPWRARQAIRNLLLNALRHGEDPIEVTLKKDSNYVHVIVSDAGPGITPERLGHVFGGALNSDVVTPATRGLGLAVARRLARMMGGDVVYRRTDRTELDFRLPLPPEPSKKD